ncbi:MAG: ribonuclease HII [Desulfomonilaceae bacterium]
MRRNIASRGVRDACPTLNFEEEARRLGYEHVAGVDEAGRGPLAGPVVAAAVILPTEGLDFSEIRDSKLLSSAKRRRLSEEIMKKAVAAVGVVEPEIIDRINILQAARQAMAVAIQQLTPLPDYVLIDGPLSLELAVAQRPIIGGDRLCMSIAAASIVAKVVRDDLMQRLHRLYPHYGFDRNKGYPTKQHRQALSTYGPTPAHRKSFHGVKEWFQ